MKMPRDLIAVRIVVSKRGDERQTPRDDPTMRIVAFEPFFVRIAKARTELNPYNSL